VSNLAVKDITPSSVTLRWSAPHDDGGADVTGYVVEKREASRRMWQSVASVPPDVTELGVMSFTAKLLTQPGLSTS